MTDSRMRISGALAIGVLIAAAACASKRPVLNVCDSKVVAPDDLVSVLRGTITAKALPGDPQTCEFSAEDLSSVSVTVRPGLGEVTVSDWTGGKAPVDAATIDGIGDRAVWQGTLHELIATRHNVLCDIGSHGTAGTEADLRKKFGQLCDKIWAAHQ